MFNPYQGRIVDPICLALFLKIIVDLSGAKDESVCLVRGVGVIEYLVEASCHQPLDR